MSAKETQTLVGHDGTLATLTRGESVPVPDALAPYVAYSQRMEHAPVIGDTDIVTVANPYGGRTAVTGAEIKARILKALEKEARMLARAGMAVQRKR